MQRFPEKDWPDTPFIEGIEWVTQIGFYPKNSFISFLLEFLVLSTIGMGPVDGTSRAQVSCVRFDRHRCQSTLLCMFVLQRNGFDYAK